MTRSTFFNMHSGVGGTRRDLGSSGQVTMFHGDRVLVTLSKGPAGPEAAPHAHAEEQWVFVAKGGCRLELDGRTLELGELDVAEIPAGVSHCVVPSTGDALILNIFDAPNAGETLPSEKACAPAPAPAGRQPNRFNMRMPKGGLPRKLAEGMNTTIFASDKLMVSAVRIDPDCKGSLHKHFHEQWGVLIEGAGKRIAENGFTPVTAGDLWYTPGNDLHTFEAGPQGAFILEVFSPPREDYLKPA